MIINDKSYQLVVPFFTNMLLKRRYHLHVLKDSDPIKMIELFSPTQCLLVLGKLFQFMPILMINMYYMITGQGIIQEIAQLTFGLTTAVYILTYASFLASSERGNYFGMMAKHQEYEYLGFVASFLTYILIAGDLCSKNLILGLLLSVIVGTCLNHYRN